MLRSPLKWVRVAAHRWDHHIQPCTRAYNTPSPAASSPSSLSATSFCRCCTRALALSRSDSISASCRVRLLRRARRSSWIREGHHQPAKATQPLAGGGQSTVAQAELPTPGTPSPSPHPQSPVPVPALAVSPAAPAGSPGGPPAPRRGRYPPPAARCGWGRRGAPGRGGGSQGCPPAAWGWRVHPWGWKQHRLEGRTPKALLRGEGPGLKTALGVP